MEAEINPELETCNNCGEQIDKDLSWIIDAPLCTNCWIEEKNKDIGD